MSMSYSLDFPLAHSACDCTADIRVNNSDFVVNEVMPETFPEAGEHVTVLIEKDGQNTAFVARRLANFSGVREMDVGYCGLKDRHAVTRQWFSVYFGRRPQPDWDKWRLEDTSILEISSHAKKLRRGDHKYNAFEITLRNLESLSVGEFDQEKVDNRLQLIKEKGVPNYFGEQRFGRDCHNLHVAEEWFSGRKRMKVKAGAMYISAARAYLFNQVLADRVKQDIWNTRVEGDLANEQGQILGPLFGDGPHKETEASLSIIANVSEQWPLLVEGLRNNRIAVAHRPLVLMPEGLQWQWEKDTLCVKFNLPVGAFATSVLREIVDYKDVAKSDR